MPTNALHSRELIQREALEAWNAAREAERVATYKAAAAAEAFVVLNPQR